MMRTVCCICIQLFLLCELHLGGWAQLISPVSDPVFRVDHIGVSDGLTQGSVYYMLKDSRGFLWFGTQDGLNRYDGHHFRTYRPALEKNGTVVPGSIRGVNIFGIVEDPDGNLWIGTEEGLNRYDRRLDRFDCFCATETAHKRSDLASRTLPFFIDKTTLLYLSDSEGLVRFEYRKQRKTILDASLHPTKEYDLQSSTMRTSAGDVWLHASTGLLRYSVTNQTLFRYFSDHPQSLFGPALVVFSFCIDSDDIIWMGTNTGLIRFDYRHTTYQTYNMVNDKPISAIYSIAPDQRGRLWLGTQQDGVLYFDKQRQTFGQVNDFTNNTRSLSEFKISKVYVDNLGIIWANTDPDGLARIVPDAFLFRGIAKRQAASMPADRQLSNYTVRGFMEEQDDRIWILTENGINVLNPRTNRIVERFLTTTSTDRKSGRIIIKSLFRDPKGRIWVGTSGGVLAFEPETKTFTAILFASSSSSLVADNYVRKLVSINDTTLMAATEDGLFSLNISQRRWVKVPVLAGQNIFSLWYDASRQQLWAGTFLNGYYCYQLPKTGELSAGLFPWHFIKSGLKGYTVLNIRPDANQKTLWLSSDRGLIALGTRGNQFRLYTERQGMTNSFVYGTLIDSRNAVWLSTNRGISRLDSATQTIKNFMPNDGLQGDEFNGNAFLRATNGELYFGGVNGFNRFQPDAFRSSTFQPVVYIYSLSINEEPFTWGTYVGEASRIDLDHTQNTLALEFAALDYGSNGHNAYQYQLTNYDDRWVSAGERNYVRYANLPPGDYTFQVKAANQDGQWSTHIRKLSIHIEPPFWRTLPFVIIVLLLFMATAWAWIRQRENDIRYQQADRLRLAYDIQEQVKKEIARDVHDEVGTRLATIKLYTTQLTQQTAETPAILALKATIFQLINDTIGDVRNLLRKLNPQTLEQHGYVAAVEELFSRITASDIINAQFILDDTPENDDRLLADTEVMLYRITQELVSNSLKHANASQIDLHMIHQATRLVLIYHDNGRGFNYEHAQKNSAGLGLGNIESRIAILGGRISWQSQSGEGVQATIEIPIRPIDKRYVPKSRTNLPQSG
jgi:signal transduction histidine kinase/ligand-binding sensor domain-containing protein